MGYCPFCNFQILIINKENLRVFQDHTLNKDFLSVFSQENSPLEVGFLPK